MIKFYFVFTALMLVNLVPCGSVFAQRAGSTPSGFLSPDIDPNGNRDKHIKYVGFYNYRITANEIALQSHLANTVAIELTGTSSAQLAAAVALLKVAQQNNVKARLDLPATLDPANTAVFANVMTTLLPYKAVIEAFYPGDEPYWNAWSAYAEAHGLGESKYDLPPAIQQQLSDEVQAKWEKLIPALKTSFPTTPIALVEAWRVLTPVLENNGYHWKIPAGVDWVGFDYYGDPEKSRGAPMMAYLNLLKSKLSASQKIIIVPPSHVSFKTTIPNPVINLPRQQELADNISFFWDYAFAEPKVVAVWPWFYHHKGSGEYIDGKGENLYKGFTALPDEVTDYIVDLIQTTIGTRP